MAITVAWDNTAPDDTDDPRLGASDFRNFKQGLNERVEQAGIFWEDPSGTNADAGKICTGIQAADTWTLYANDKSTSVLLADDSDDSLTLGSGWTFNADTGIITAITCDDLTVANNPSMTRVYERQTGSSGVAFSRPRQARSPPPSCQ